MKLATLAITAVSAGAAVVAGVGSYHAVAPSKTDTHLEAAVTPPATGTSTRTPPPLGTVTRFADCPRGTELRGKVCIRLEERTVVEYVAAPAPVYQPVAPATTTATRPDPSTSGGTGDDDGPGPAAPPADDDGDRDDRDEDRDHEDEDHEDEDHGDEHEDRDDD